MAPGDTNQGNSVTCCSIIFPPFRPDMDMVLSFRRKRCGSFSERKKRETGQRGSTFPLALLDVQPTVDYEPSPKEAPPSVRGIWPWPRLVGQDLQGSIFIGALLDLRSTFRSGVVTVIQQTCA